MNPSRTPSFGEILRDGARDDSVRGALRRYVRQAVVPLIIAVSLVAVWCATAPLSGAIIAPAQVKVELNRKTVQHQEGGIVREILVRDGQKVRAGDALVVVSDLRNAAALRLIQDQLESERVRKARAMAEAALQPRFGDASTPQAPDAAEHWAHERALFTARRRVLDELLASLQAQARSAESQAAALASQIEATETSARLSAEEVEINEKLVRQGFIARTRMLALQRAESDYRARVGESRSDLAVARQRIGDLNARMTQARVQYVSQATDEIKDATAKIRELEERLRPSQDQADRQTVRSPVDGEVMSLRVSAPGAVVGPREAILDVVPGREKLVVEARIRPHDIDHAKNSRAADVRLGAFDSRDTPVLPGSVVFVSADRVTSPQGGEPWFVATIEIDGATLARHPDLRLHAGMPAEVYLRTPERTVLAYVAKSLHVFSYRAMREP
jgi:HlyD family type I secretion membrane fusion protein